MLVGNSAPHCAELLVDIVHFEGVTHLADVVHLVVSEQFSLYALIRSAPRLLCGRDEAVKPAEMIFLPVARCAGDGKKR